MLSVKTKQNHVVLTRARQWRHPFFILNAHAHKTKKENANPFWYIDFSRFNNAEQWRAVIVVCYLMRVKQRSRLHKYVVFYALIWHELTLFFVFCALYSSRKNEWTVGTRTILQFVLPYFSSSFSIQYCEILITQYDVYKCNMIGNILSS